MEESSCFFDSLEEITASAQETVETVYVSTEGYSMISRAEIGGRLVALKSLKPEFRADPLFGGLLRKEYELGKGLDHPGLCRTLDFISLPKLGNCIEMEWIEGETLDSLLQSGARLPGKKILLELCDALDYLHHKQVIHRDLKPSNIIVTKNGHNVKIIDFGLADEDSSVIFKQPAGTMAYASPEQKRGEILDNRSDIYSLGIVMGQMGMCPRVAAKCVREDREKRYSDVSEVKSAIAGRSRGKFAMAVAGVIIALSLVAYAAAPEIRSSLRKARLERVLERLSSDIERVAY